MRNSRKKQLRNCLLKLREECDQMADSTQFEAAVIKQLRDVQSQIDEVCAELEKAERNERRDLIIRWIIRIVTAYKTMHICRRFMRRYGASANVHYLDLTWTKIDLTKRWVSA